MFDQIKNNWKSGVSVALVSVPLSFSLAIASGAGPMAGIITATWAGLLAGIFGGSQYNIVGPAGALAGILIGYSITYGQAILPILAIVSGFVILAIWFLGWDKYLILVPSSVVHGFTLGVALTIGFGQLNYALGLSGLPVHENIIMNIFESLRNINHINFGAFVPFIIGLSLMFIVLKLKPLWPNSIIVAIIGIILGYLSVHNIIPLHFQTVGTKFPNLSGNLFVLPKISDLLNNHNFSALTHFYQIVKITEFSLVVAFVATLETLISAKTADGMTKTKFMQSKEVFGLSLANIASGFFGGLPASGVFARTALNVKSGASSNYSQIINAVSVGLISVVFISGFSYLPLSITASILVYAAIRMITAEHFRKIYKFDKSAFGLAMVVAALTFAMDATTGILVGTVSSLLLFANKLSTIELGSNEDPDSFNPEEDAGRALIYRFAGAMTYFNSKSHIERIIGLQTNKPIILNFRHLHYIDVDGYDSINEIIEILAQKKQKVYIVGVKPEMLGHFKHHVWFTNLERDKKVCPSTDIALSLV